MDKFINYREMMEYKFDDEKKGKKAAKIAEGMIKARSPRATDIAEQLDGKSETNRKMIHRIFSIPYNPHPRRVFNIIGEARAIASFRHCEPPIPRLEKQQPPMLHL